MVEVALLGNFSPMHFAIELVSLPGVQQLLQQVHEGDR